MRKTLIAILAVSSLTALGATAFAATSTATKGDDLFLKANSTATVAEKAEPLKAVNVKNLKLDDMDSERGGHGEMGEGMDD